MTAAMKLAKHACGNMPLQAWGVDEQAWSQIFENTLAQMGCYCLLPNCTASCDTCFFASTNNPNEAAQMQLAVSVALLVMQKAPELFDKDLIMIEPVSFIRGQQVVAKSYYLKTVVNQEVMESIKGIYGLDIESELYNLLSDEIAEELRRHQKLYRHHYQYNYCPYVPVIPVRAVDPNNMQPMIGFHHRFGWIK